MGLPVPVPGVLAVCGRVARGRGRGSVKIRTREPLRMLAELGGGVLSIV